MAQVPKSRVDSFTPLSRRVDDGRDIVDRHPMLARRGLL